MRGRDRTAEFIATINSKRDKPQYIQKKRQQQQQNIQNRPIIDKQYKELMQISQQCSYRISESFAKLERFTHLARKRTVFDDGELNKLIAEIRTDIGETTNQLTELQSKCEPKQRHTVNIVTILKRKLECVNNNFQSTLMTRSQSLQQQTARHELYAGPTTTTTSPTNSSYQPNGPVVLDMMGTGPSSSSQHHHHHHYNNCNNTNNLGEQQQLSQQLYLDDRADLAGRADQMQLIESTIVELGTVFNQLAHIVQDQGETITRIDMNISETTANVEMAHDALLRYFASINSNRWLILKVFGVLFFFFIIFVVFSS